MLGYFNQLKNLFTYKGPSEKEPFELLEGEDEIVGNKKQENHKTAKEAENRRNDKRRKPKKLLGANKGQQEKEMDTADRPVVQQVENDNSDLTVVEDININLQNIREELNLSKNQSIIIREFNIGRRIKGFVVFIKGMIDEKSLNETILKQLMNPENFNLLEDEDPVDYIINNVIPINDIKKESKMEEIVSSVLSGKTTLFIDGCNQCILMDTVGYEKRNIDKPVTETVVRGSQEAFTEDLETNISIIRRIIKNKNLIVEMVSVGNTSNTGCAIIYIEDTANDELVQEVRRRVKGININSMLGDGMLEQMIEDHPYMILPQVLGTERPDRTCAFLTEGKVAIIAGGAPFANIVPISFFHLFHTSEDYFLRWQYGTFLRLIRLIAFSIALYLPSMYVALSLFHQEMIPTELLASIAQSRESVPFPVIVEILFMEISFELIREAGIRVPTVLGQTIGIIGALILGQAAVEAGLVSPVLLIVVAVTGLGNFAVPNYSLAIAMRIIRFANVILASIVGFYGIVIGTFIMGCLGASMKSFGVPYFSPVAPKTKSNHDIILREPLWRLNKRTDMLNTKVNRKK